MSEAREYYDSLIAQGYPVHEALPYTQQYFPEFVVADNHSQIVDSSIIVGSLEQMQPHEVGGHIHSPQQYVVAGESGPLVPYGVPGQPVMVMVESQKPQQNGLIKASYVCSCIGLFIFGIILGPIGFTLGLIAKSNGDQRGNGAMIFGGVVTILSLIIIVVMINLGMI